VANPYLGEIRAWAGVKIPKGWRLCNGDLVLVSDNDALFQLIGTTYGGDGETSFQLPDLRGRVPVHVGNGMFLGQGGGAETVTLRPEQLPPHNHLVQGSTALAMASTVGGNVPASTPPAPPVRAYGSRDPIHALDPASVAVSGGGGAHPNMQPYLAVNYIIAMLGIFPPPAETEE
jgi:microcystin-dependent protein